MSTAIAKNLQVGADPTATNNFTIYQPATPDGTLRIGNGNTGITSSLLTLTSAGNLGVGTSSPGYRLEVNSGSGAFPARLTTTTTNALLIFGDSGTTGLGPFVGSAGNNLTFGRAGVAEYVRIDTSGNMGIGVTTVNGKLDVKTASDSKIIFNDGTTTGNARLEAVNIAYSAYRPFETNGSIQLFATGGAERMRINSIGGVGIGTTNADQGKLTVFNASNGSPATSGSSDPNIITRIASGAIALDTGVYASGIAWIQNRLANNYANNYGLALNPNGGNVGVRTSAAANAFQVGDGTADTRGVFYSNNAYALGIANGAGFAGWIGGSGATDTMVFSSSGGTERMRLDSSGNLGLGTTSPVYKLVVSNAGAAGLEISPTGGIGSGGFVQAYNRSSGQFFDFTTYAANIIFAAGNAGSERARITSGGELLVGKTASGDNVVGFQVSGGGRLSCGMASGDAYILYSTSAPGYRFYVTNGGVVNATSTTISAISDQRLKENVQDIDVGLNAVMALKPRKFDWREGKGKNTKGDRGWIAQEFEQVFPDMIDTWKDPAPEGEEPYKSVRADLIPILVKAIQEQQVMIEQLQADVAALKGAV
jgi:hypothetical protein